MNLKRPPETPDAVLLRIEQIVSLYQRTRKKIAADLGSLKVSPFSEIKSQVVRMKIRGMISDLNQKMNLWAARSIASTYNESAKKAAISLSILGTKKSPYFNPETHNLQARSYYDLLVSDFHKANMTILKSVEAILNLQSRAASVVKQIQNFDTPPMRKFDIWDFDQASNLFDSWAREAVQKQWSRKVLSDMIEQNLRDSLDDGDFIEINDRRYNLDSYAEMVARTRLREAQTEATKQMCTEYDNDLVLFSTHANSCDMCAPLEGQIFSLTGLTPGYPELTSEEEPPIHPNCGHSISPTSAEAIAIRGEDQEAA